MPCRIRSGARQPGSRSVSPEERKISGVSEYAFRVFGAPTPTSALDLRGYYEEPSRRERPNISPKNRPRRRLGTHGIRGPGNHRSGWATDSGETVCPWRTRDAGRWCTTGTRAGGGVSATELSGQVGAGEGSSLAGRSDEALVIHHGAGHPGSRWPGSRLNRGGSQQSGHPSHLASLPGFPRDHCHVSPSGYSADNSTVGHRHIETVDVMPQ